MGTPPRESKPGSEPAFGTPRSVWTAADEARLKELLERKARIMQENREPLRTIVESFHIAQRFAELSPSEVVESTIDDMIACAQGLRDALAPFDQRSALP